MVLGAIIGGIATAVLGGISSSSQASAQNDAQAKLDKYNAELWDFNWQQDNRNRDFQIRQNAAQRTNLANERAYTIQSQIRDFQYSQQMDTAKYNAELQAFKKSDEIFSNQLRLNQAGLDLAMAQQGQWMREQELNYQFRSADLGLQLQAAVNDYTQSLITEGLNKTFADQEFEKTSLFSKQSRNLAISQAEQDYNQAANSSTLRKQLTTDQANQEFALTSANSRQKTELTNRQSQEAFDLATRNAREKFQSQVRNARADQENLRVSTSREQELAAVDAMQRKGAAQAGQAGRSTAKLAQSIGFIAGMNQAALADRILFGEEGVSRQIADAGISMQQTGRQAGTEAKQQMESAVLADFQTQAAAEMKKNQTIESALLSDMITKQDASIRRSQLTQNAATADFQNQYDAQLKRSQAGATSSLRIAKAEADRQLAQTNANISGTGLLASLVSARISNEYTQNSIRADKYMADLNAYASKMLPPMEPLQRPAPLLLPEPIILDPPELIKPPKPVGGAMVSPVAAFLGGAAGGIGSVLGAAFTKK